MPYRTGCAARARGGTRGPTNFKLSSGREMRCRPRSTAEKHKERSKEGKGDRKWGPMVPAAARLSAAAVDCLLSGTENTKRHHSRSSDWKNLKQGVALFHAVHCSVVASKHNNSGGAGVRQPRPGSADLRQLLRPLFHSPAVGGNIVHQGASTAIRAAIGTPLAHNRSSPPNGVSCVRRVRRGGHSPAAPR